MQSIKQRQHNTNSSTYLELQQSSTREQIRALPLLERKTSKRRESQQQRVVVFDLFKQLLAQINQGYVHINALKLAKNTQIKTPRIPKQKTKGKQESMRYKKQTKAKKDIQQQNRLRIEKKEQILANYSVLMKYQITLPELEIHSPVAIIEQTQQ